MLLTGCGQIGKLAVALAVQTKAPVAIAAKPDQRGVCAGTPANGKSPP